MPPLTVVDAPPAEFLELGKLRLEVPVQLPGRLSRVHEQTTETRISSAAWGGLCNLESHS